MLHEQEKFGASVSEYESLIELQRSTSSLGPTHETTLQTCSAFASVLSVPLLLGASGRVGMRSALAAASRFVEAIAEVPLFGRNIYSIMCI